MKTAAARPKETPFAIATASSMSGAGSSTAIGPKTSFWASSACGETPSTSVGCTNHPLRSAAAPPATTRPPARRGAVLAASSTALAGAFVDHRADDGRGLSGVSERELLDRGDKGVCEVRGVTHDDHP